MIKDFDELEVWQKANGFLMKIYDIVQDFPREEQCLLIKQLLSAAASIGANIAEGFGRYHYQENIQFLRMARGSAAESKNHLIVAFQRNYITEELYKSLAEETRIIRLMINKSIKITQSQIQKEKNRP